MDIQVETQPVYCVRLTENELAAALVDAQALQEQLRQARAAYALENKIKAETRAPAPRKPRKAQLVLSKRAHSNGNGPAPGSLVCDECGAVFHTDVGLAVHRGKQHTAKRSLASNGHAVAEVAL